MSSPAKRRKRNVPESSPRKSRSIASFFQGQATKQAARAEHHQHNTDENDTEQTVSDEALARKLQEQWNQEESASGPSTQATSDDPTTRDVTEATDPEPAPATKESKKNTLSLQPSTGTEDTVSLSVPLDQSPLTFDATKYAEELQSHWAAEGGDASYALLTRAFVLVNATTSRIRIVDTLVNFLRVLIDRKSVV